ncbi:dehydrogenase/reductase SDR family member 7 isoform X1 [Neodiprion pinetum]|uniref:dehydrogenase/reductase SDR family member 7 isoform X1 n=1 Tax=Neodiprion pinetum TaxID=441929 RepID=UPI001EDFEF13|nr:dehydrogenase/reductase SDR family member 7 isoform X1 [Neodiprion pinetum]
MQVLVIDSETRDPLVEPQAFRHSKSPSSSYYLFHFIAQVFLDCDLHLAYKEKYGKPIDTLRNKVVWITGASSGIGEHLAYVLASAGCKLILSARREVELLRVKERCIAGNKLLTADDVEVLVLDVVAIETHEEAFKHVINKFGKLDILVNNAGRTQRALWAEIEIDVDRQMFELNVFGTISLSRIAMKYFSKRGEGHIAVTSSLAGVMSVPFSATYTATKHALHGYFGALRLETFGQNTKITIFCPGPTQTPFLAESFTGKSGEKLGEETAVSDAKMSSERCANLFAVALANEIYEAWAAYPKVMLLVHICAYYPNILNLLPKFISSKKFLDMRDSKQVLKTE